MKKDKREQISECVRVMRARRKEAGMQRVEVWVHADDAPRIHALAEALLRSRGIKPQ